MRRGMRTIPEQVSFFDTLQNDWGVFFWRPPGFLSNWTPSPFTYEGVAYCHAEQAIMHRKALLFDDPAMARSIMASSDPKHHKAYGRRVRNFDQGTWDHALVGLVYGILLAKFSQNLPFAVALLGTAPKKLFESSPRDLVWGTGVSPEVAFRSSKQDALHWKGANLLGRTLMEVRDALAEQDAAASRPRASLGDKHLPEANYFETLQNEWGVFFWRPPGFLSNWTPSPFTYNGVAYCHAEQATVHQKALLFRDLDKARCILASSDPKEHNAYGSRIRNFDQAIWDCSLPDLLFGILHAKFSQNPAFAAALVDTAPKELFESSPIDMVWGTGVSLHDSVRCSKCDTVQWKGGNLLGKTLMKVRDALVEKEDASERP